MGLCIGHFTIPGLLAFLVFYGPLRITIPDIVMRKESLVLLRYTMYLLPESLAGIGMLAH
jgi:hypothetical protein